MFKTALIGTLVAAGIAAAAPAQADTIRFGIRFGQVHHDDTDGWRFDRHPGGVTAWHIRRTVRNRGCNEISPVNRSGGRYRVTATCTYGERVVLTFSARSGPLPSERVIGFDRVPRGRRERGQVSIPAYR